MIELGGFVLQSRIGRGGMGEVWRAVHPRRRLRAAVKVVTARHPRFVAGLETEIRAVASLHHPHIVRLYDTGRVDALAAEASHGSLADGDPWLAMELVEGGQLELPAPDWTSCRRVLLQLLDALAHAHARGFVHCDLKPDNVLLDADGNARLTDFGIARANDRTAATDQPSGGTPLWMAPEQFLGDEAWIGPWTDLYTLGCMAWALIAGHAPYGSGAIAGLMRAHLQDPLPPLDAPPAFRAWLDRLTAKDPGARYRRAADAAWALQRLPDPGGHPTELMPRDPGVGLVATPPRGPEPPPLPTSWRDAEPPTAAAAPSELGLGLLRLREIPLVGRAEARDALFAALVEADAGSPRAVVLRGPAGCGKSALAHWICHVSHALGAAETVRVAVEDGADFAREAVSIATRAHLADDLDEHLTALGVPEVEAVRELLEAPRTPHHLAAPDRRLDVALGALRACAAGRVLVLWTDDAHLLPEGPALAERALQSGGRVLVVLTVRDDLLGQNAEAAHALERLQARDDVQTLDIGPLPRDQVLALLERAVPLRAELADTVADRAEGVSLFALQLVAEWIDRGVLVPRGPRWDLAPNVSLPVPVPLRRIWLDRVEAALEGHPRSWRRALQAAAALGRDVDRDEWADVTALVQLQEPPAGLLPVLVARGLARVDVDTPSRRWRFVHGLLPASIVDGAPDAEALHLACAEVLERRGVAMEGRRAAHLEAAHRADDALAAWRGYAEWLQLRDLGGAVRAARRAARVATPMGGRVLADTWLQVSRIERMRGTVQGWEQALQRALGALDGLDEPGLRAEALASLGWLRTDSRRLDEARALGREAATLLPRIEAGPHRFDVLSSLGILLILAWDNEAAIPVLRAAADEAPSDLLRGQKLTFLAWALVATDDLPGAVAAIEQAEPMVSEALPARAQWCFTAASVRWEQGDRPGAIALLREAVEAKLELGADPSAWILQLAGHQCAAGETDAADDTLARLSPVAAEGAGPLALRVRIAGVRGDDVELEQALDRLATVDPKQLGLGAGRWIEEAGDRVAPRRADLARRCWRVARVPAANFGHDDHVARLDDKLSGRVRFH